MESYGRIFKDEKGRLPLITSSYSSLINNNDSNFSWPPRTYNCTFCKRIFKSAQALGGHMNVHRRDRAKLRQYSPPPPPNPNPNPNPTTLISSSTNTATSKANVPNLNLLPPPCTSSGFETKVSTSTFYSPVITNSLSSSIAKPVSCCSKSDELKMDVLFEVKKLKRFDVEEESAMMTRRGSVDKDLDLELRLGYI